RRTSAGAYVAVTADGAVREEVSGMGRAAAAEPAEVEAVNEVRLAGRISGEPEERVLPSGDRVVVFRVVVAREGGRPDTIDCAAFRGDLRRKLRGWTAGDVVELDGSLRR